MSHRLALLVLLLLAGAAGCSSGRASVELARDGGTTGAQEKEGRSTPTGSMRAPRVETRSEGSGDAGADRPGYVQWCSSGGAPLVGLPVVDSQERAYVATSDGYLHAFERDGRFRWSYTVKGTPLGSVSIRSSDGDILIGTTARYVYSINQSGVLRWAFQTLSPVWSGLFGLNPETVVFLGHDTRLYALGNNGAALYRVRAPSDPMGGPVIARGDVVWLPLADGVARFEAAFRLKRYPLTVPVEDIVVLGDGILARGGGQVFYMSAAGESKLLGLARFVGGDGRRALLVGEGDEIELVDEKLSRTPVALGQRSGTARISAPPALSGESIWIPREDGSVHVLRLDTGKAATVEVVRGPLSTPVVGPSGKWALIAEPGGEFCAVNLDER